MAKRRPGSVDPALDQQIRTMTLLGIISPKKAAALRKQARIADLLKSMQPPATPAPAAPVEVEPGVVIGESK